MKPATCHPEKPHKSRGLCSACYQRVLYSENPERYIGYSKKFYRENTEEVLKYRRQFSKDNREKLRIKDNEYYHNNKEKCLETQHKWIAANPERQLADAAKIRAKKAGLPYSITFKDIIIPSHCPLLGIPLKRGKKVRQDNSPTLDRLDGNRGYVKGNIAVISYRANRIKNDATLKELETIAANLRKLLNA